VLPPQPAGRSEREAAESFLYIGVRSYRGPFPPSGRQRVESSIYGLRSLPASTRGSRGGPVSGREVTQNDGVARERKRPAQSPSRAITAGHGTLRTNLTRWGSRVRVPSFAPESAPFNQPQCRPHPDRGPLCGRIHRRKTNECRMGWRREPGRARSASRSELGERDRTEFQGKETRGTLLNARP
jgi:hypothetical protein